MKIGDVVRLKCGGPLMVVDMIYEQKGGRDIDTVHVAWPVDAKDQTFRYARFPEAVFDIVKEA